MTIQELIDLHKTEKEKSNEIYVWYGDILPVNKVVFNTWNGKHITVLALPPENEYIAKKK